MEELHRILDKDNGNFIDEVKGRWHDFCQKVQFFGVWKKMLKPPMGMDKGKQWCFGVISDQSLGWTFRHVNCQVHVLVSCRPPFSSMMVIPSLTKCLFFKALSVVYLWSDLTLCILSKCCNESFPVQLNRLLRSYVCCHHCSPPPLPPQRGYEMRVRLWCMSSRWAV